jgi:TRAP-type C4-dicarboxylate transport system permease small subunit
MPKEEEGKDERAEDAEGRADGDAKADVDRKADADAKTVSDSEKAKPGDPEEAVALPKESASLASSPATGVAKAAWAAPLARFDAAWTRLEVRLVTFVLLTEIASLCLWITLKGLSAEYEPQSPTPNLSGLVFRSLISATVLGVIAHFATRPKDYAAILEKRKHHEVVERRPEDDRHAYAVTAAIVLGLALGRVWANAGASYTSNLLNWLQSASTLSLIGGLRGLVTRLTLWVALLGASIATGQGKHINVDVVMRFLSPKMRVPVAVVGWIAAATVCGAAVWGFFDHIAIEGFKAESDAPPAAKIATAKEEMGRDFFLLGRQISLDLKTLPKVLGGTKYSEYLKAPEWNAWMKEGGWTAHFKQEDVDALLMDESQPDATHMPQVSVPGTGENVAGLLIHTLNLVFPFGLAMIALRFVLRALLAIGGHVRVDPEAAHGDEDIERVVREEAAELEAEAAATSGKEVRS